MKHRVLVSCGLIVMVACGGSVSDSTEERSRPESDQDASMAAPDARPVDAQTTEDAMHDAIETLPTTGACPNQGRTAYCVSCCLHSHLTGGFELLFYSECQSCDACAGLAPCDLSLAGPGEATPECISCLKARFRASSGWPRCLQNADCTAYVGCLEGCPLSQ